MEAIETLEQDGVTAKLFYDEDPMSPRDWDQVGTLVTWARRHTFDEDGSKRFGEPADFLREARRNRWIYLPVAMMDHSGLRLWEGRGPAAGDSAGWDSGQVGYIYATRESLEKTGVTPRKAKRALRAEIKTWDQYVSGDVYGYTVECEDGECEESCWGFYGHDDAMSEMRAALKHCAEKHAQHEKQVAEATPEALEAD